ncbi:MAG TPA: PEP-CTERM sorting domain-containing protein [Gemmataceae bacterium]|nr:PEP-CTERM sorting domain-containing protein [Gemmataceae bacterium]
MKMRMEIVFAALVLVYTGTARAGTIIHGDEWVVSNNTVNGISGGAIPANVPGTSPDVSFTVSPVINLSTPSNGSNYTIGTFLSSATILAGSSHSNDVFTDSIFRFGPAAPSHTTADTITVTTGETFSATHDDGITLVINGQTVISAPFQTSAETSTGIYTGPSGTFPFELVYEECCGAPAVLSINLTDAATVPEPGTWLLFGTGLAGLFGYAWRGRQRQAA